MHQKASIEYGELKRSLIARGVTINSWAIRRRYRPSTVYAAAKGDRAGIKSTRIVKELEDFIYGKGNR